MSLYDYRLSLDVASDEWTFKTLLWAAMRRADDMNAERFQLAFPEAWRELQERFHSPNGVLATDVERNE